jgi:hypothetical protein
MMGPEGFGSDTVHDAAQVSSEGYGASSGSNPTPKNGGWPFDRHNALEMGKDADKLRALKQVLTDVAHGEDQSEHFPSVVKLVPHKDLEVRLPTLLLFFLPSCVHSFLLFSPPLLVADPEAGVHVSRALCRERPRRGAALHQQPAEGAQGPKPAGPRMGTPRHHQRPHPCHRPHHAHLHQTGKERKKKI